VVEGASFVRNYQMGCGVNPAFYLIGARVLLLGKAAEI
jgi:hypothetical protein